MSCWFESTQRKLMQTEYWVKFNFNWFAYIKFPKHNFPSGIRSVFVIFKRYKVWFKFDNNYKSHYLLRLNMGMVLSHLKIFRIVPALVIAFMFQMVEHFPRLWNYISNLENLYSFLTIDTGASYCDYTQGFINQIPGNMISDNVS